jgi:hypothetical protein
MSVCTLTSCFASKPLFVAAFISYFQPWTHHTCRSAVDTYLRLTEGPNAAKLPDVLLQVGNTAWPVISEYCRCSSL